MRVALAGIILIILLGALVSTWYWVIPRDDVEIDILYLQRNGHVVLAELTNDGSREIRDVTLTVDFVDQENTVLDSLTVSFDSIPSLTSVSGDKMELDLRGYSVWENIRYKFKLNGPTLEVQKIKNNSYTWCQNKLPQNSIMIAKK